MKGTHSENDDSDGSEKFFDAEESLPPQQRHTLKKRSPITSHLDERFVFPAAGQPSTSTATSAPATLHTQQQPPLQLPSGRSAAAAAPPPTVLSSPTSSAGRQPANAATGHQMHDFLEPKTTSRQRFRELRQCMQHDEDENPGNTLTPDSQNSSVEGVFPTQRPTHPFRIIEPDAMSMTSLGRVGRILAGSDVASISTDRSEPSVGSYSVAHSNTSPSVTTVASPALIVMQTSSPTMPAPVTENAERATATTTTQPAAVAGNTENVQRSEAPTDQQPVQQNFSEPDVIASTKFAHSKTTDSLKTSAIGAAGPVAPPRLKKKGRKLSATTSEQFQPNESQLNAAHRSHPFTDSVSLKLDLNLANNQQKLTQPQPAPIVAATTTLSTCTTTRAPSSGDTTPPLQMQAQQPPNQLSLSSPATAAIASLTRDIENSFTESAAALKHPPYAVASTSASASSVSSASNIHGSGMPRVSHSLGNSVTSVYAPKPSPSNSAKSNSAPGRVHAIDPNQGLNLFKATRGQYVVKPQDEPALKAEGPSLAEIERVERIRAEILGGGASGVGATRAASVGQARMSDRSSIAGPLGTNSLGSGMRFSTSAARLAAGAAAAARERRKSAGDEDVLRQLNIYVRTRTDSGKQLTDLQILEQVPVKNLDTGERIPLSSMKPPPVPAGWNPLSLHIHKLTCHLDPLLAQQKESDEESVVGIPAETEPATSAGDGDEDGDSAEGDGGRLRKKTARLRHFLGSTMRKTVVRAKLIASEVSHARHKEDVADIIDVVNPEQNIKIKASSTNKGPYEFTKLQHVQDLSGEHTGAVWCMKFSSCGRLLATAGQDRVLRIWVLKEAYTFFQDMRTKYNADQKSSPTPSQESLVSHHSADDAAALAQAADAASGPFMPKAFCTYTGHTSDLLDVSWSKNYFILSSSMDKTVRLWHISRRECLCCFQHIDFVTAIAFHPRDDRYFLSGSLDGKLRLWNIPDKKVALWNEVDGQTKLITAANFCQNGKFAVVGTYDGRCIFYNTDQLKYHTQIHVRSTRGRNKTGRKISGIEPMPGEDKILVTSNDSRVRLYDLRDLNLSCKYKGYANVSSQIKASFSNDGKYIVAGSENQCIYIWKTRHDYSKLSSVRRDRSDFWEGIKAHNATVTCAIFAPNPEAIIKSDPDDDNISRTSTTTVPDPMAEQRKRSCGYVLISADFNGAMKVFINKTKPKHSSLPYTAIQD